MVLTDEEDEETEDQYIEPPIKSEKDKYKEDQMSLYKVTSNKVSNKYL